MIKFEFNNSDLPIDEKQYYHNTSVSKERMEDANITEIISLFRNFLRGMSFTDNTIKEYLGEE